MENTFGHSQLSQLNLIVTECSKQYFLIKNQLYDQIQDMQNTSKNKIDICHLIDTQHTLIKELGNVVKYLFSELSFRKCIIERKDRVLKDLNGVMINKFIDKIYKQEQLIIELQKYQTNKSNNYSNSNNNSSISISTSGNNMPSFNNKAKRVITKLTKSVSPNANVIVPDNNNSQVKKPNANVNPNSNIIAPKTKVEYNGTVSFFNSSIRNISRFINKRNTDSNNDEGKGGKERQLIKKHYNNNSHNIIVPNKIQKAKTESLLSNPRNKKPTRPKSVESLASKNNISNISISNSNISINSNIAFNRTLARPSKNTTALLNKSYELVKKYHIHLNKSLPKKSSLEKSILGIS